MYEVFYGLKDRPFDLTSNPKYLFLTPSHREALSNLEYGISARTGVTVMVGEAGTGKTTLIRAMLASGEGRKTHVLYLNNPTLTRDEFLAFLAQGFNLEREAADSKLLMLSGLERVLLQQLGLGVTPALIVDEAQALPDDLLEEIRLLSNVETPLEKLLPIVLAGQPELAARLNEPSFRQLKQRVGLRCQLRPLELSETAAYIAGRVRVAGGDAARLFTREAVIAIHQGARGIPRTISVICHNALITGLALEKRPVGAEIIAEVCRDFELGHGARGDGRGGDRHGPPRRRAGSETQGTQGHPASPAADRGLFATITTSGRRFSLF